MVSSNPNVKLNRMEFTVEPLTLYAFTQLPESKLESITTDPISKVFWDGGCGRTDVGIIFIIIRCNIFYLT